MERVWRSKRTERGGTDRRESDVATYKDKGFMDVHTRNETKEWKEERKKERDVSSFLYDELLFSKRGTVFQTFGSIRRVPGVLSKALTCFFFC